MNGREKWKPRKKGRLRTILIIAALLAAAAAVLVGAHNGKYNLYRKKGFTRSLTTEYSEGVPLEEMNFKRYLAVMPADAPVLVPDLVIMISLPCDVRYYIHRGDAEPAFTLKKGTEVYAVPSTEGIEEGYGTVSWPGYEKGWRYARPFVTEDASDISFDDPMYFVRMSELEQVSRAFLRANRKSAGPGRIPEMVWMQTRFIDMAFYRQGVFCSEDLERMFLW